MQDDYKNKIKTNVYPLNMACGASTCSAKGPKHHPHLFYRVHMLSVERRFKEWQRDSWLENGW